jgi:hypothetical protein
MTGLNACERKHAHSRNRRCPASHVSRRRGAGCFVCHPAHSALRGRRNRKVGCSIDAIRVLPRKRRSEELVDQGGRIQSWVITEGSVRTPQRDAELTAEERKLAIAEIWNHTFLVDAIARGWMPQQQELSMLRIITTACRSGIRLSSSGSISMCVRHTTRIHRGADRAQLASPIAAITSRG